MSVVGEWIAVDEETPCNKVEVVAFGCKDESTWITAFLGCDNCWWTTDRDGDRREIYPPTHFMYLDTP